MLPKLNHRSDVITDVTNALNAGHEVTISQSQINFKGWTGSGYIIIDPNNGSGAYMISGGANGGLLLFVVGIIALAFSLFFIGAFLAASFGVGSLVLAGIGSAIWYDSFQGFLDTGRRASELTSAGKIDEATSIVSSNVLILVVSALGGAVLRSVGDGDMGFAVFKLFIYDITTWLFKQIGN